MKKLVAALVLALLAYLASPYAALALVMRAASQEDEAALASRIDFDALRASLTQQLEARMAPPGEPADPGRRTMLPTLVSSFVTPRAFSAMLRSRGEQPVSGEPADDAFADLEVGWIFFTRPTRFEVHSRRGVLVLEPRGVWWRVVDFKLPPQERGPALPTPRTEPPVVPETPTLEVPDFGTPAGS